MGPTRTESSSWSYSSDSEDPTYLCDRRDGSCTWRGTGWAALSQGVCSRQLPLDVVRDRGDALERDLELCARNIGQRKRRGAISRWGVERGARTWNGFSKRAGLSSTVTFVTVTHAISPQSLDLCRRGRWRVCRRSCRLARAWTAAGACARCVVVHAQLIRPAGRAAGHLQTRGARVHDESCVASTGERDSERPQARKGAQVGGFPLLRR